MPKRVQYPCRICGIECVSGLWREDGLCCRHRNSTGGYYRLRVGQSVIRDYKKFKKRKDAKFT